MKKAVSILEFALVLAFILVISLGLSSKFAGSIEHLKSFTQINVRQAPSN